MGEAYTTYAFEDVSCVIKHPSVGTFDVNGEGAGSITFAMSGDVTEHDVAADGTVMVSKIRVSNGTIAIETQQTSSLHKWFTKAYNYLMGANAREWAEMSVMATSPAMQVTHDCAGVSFQKRGDKPYQAQGQRVTWTLMSANMKEIT